MDKELKRNLVSLARQIGGNSLEARRSALVTLANIHGGGMPYNSVDLGIGGGYTNETLGQLAEGLPRFLSRRRHA